MANEQIMKIQCEVRCIFCGEFITSSNVMACNAPSNPLPPMTCGGKPHAIESRTIGASMFPPERTSVEPAKDDGTCMLFTATNDLREGQMHLAMELERKDEQIRKLREALENQIKYCSNGMIHTTALAALKAGE